MGTVLQQFFARWDGCQKCLLAAQRCRMVFCRGQVPADVLFVGEAPGSSEDVLGQPFVGQAGRLLDTMIANAGLNRLALAFTNLVACFPREAKREGTNAPPEAAIKACAPRLSEFAGIVRPRLCVCVGSVAAKHAPKILPLPYRGDELRWVNIVHPAHVLKNMAQVQQAYAVHRAAAALRQAAEGL